MSERSSLRRQRLNPEVGEILRVIEKKWAEFSAEKDYTRRRGHAMVFAALLEQLIDEPQFLPSDLQEGTVDDERRWFPRDAFDEDPLPFLGESPFETTGPAEECAFFYTDTGVFSHIYSGPAVDPCRRPLIDHGPFVHSYEKRHATETETTMHVTSGEVLKRLFGKKRLPRLRKSGDVHSIFCDP